MKKTTALLLVVILMTSLFMVGCSKQQAVKNDLVGTWSYEVSSIDGPCQQIYMFTKTGFVSSWINENVPSKSRNDTGTYEITDSEIILTSFLDGEVTTIIKYYYDGHLVLIDTHSDGSGTRRLEKEQ